MKFCKATLAALPISAATLAYLSTSHSFTPCQWGVSLHGTSSQKNFNKVLLISSATETDSEGEAPVGPTQEFVNSGPLAWMGTYLDGLGIEEGKAVYFGPIAVDVDESKRVSDSEASARREKAARELTNIGEEERRRRNQAGDVMAVLSAVYVAWATILGDDGGFSGHVLRMLSVFPVFLAVGYKLSAQSGL